MTEKKDTSPGNVPSRHIQTRSPERTQQARPKPAGKTIPSPKSSRTRRRKGLEVDIGPSAAGPDVTLTPPR